MSSRAAAEVLPKFMLPFGKARDRERKKLSGAATWGKPLCKLRCTAPSKSATGLCSDVTTDMKMKLKR